MSRLTAALTQAGAAHRPALVAYLCAGDPHPDTTPDAIVALADAGADVIELGVPFSDPSADGPVLQRASERALARGTTLRRALDMVQAARIRTAVPIVLFGYYNPLHARGAARVAAEAREAGVDGLLTVDLPPEESATLRDPVVAAGLDWVPLVAPTSTDARIARAAEVATSFVYCISVAGVTGAGGADLARAAVRAQAVRERTGRPVALGFGIKTRDDVARVAPFVDAVVVGSAIVQAMHEGGIAAGAALVRSLRG